MSSSKNSKWWWLAAGAAGIAVGGLLVFGALDASLDQSPVCQHNTVQVEHTTEPLPPTEADRASAKEAEPEPPKQQPHFCYSGHTAEEWIGILTAALAGFTWVLAMATATLWLDTRSTGERQLRAAALNLRVAEEAHQRELRAYLCIKDIEIRPVVATKEGEFRIVVENAGKTPARGVTAELSWHEFPSGTPYNFKYWDIYRDATEPRDVPFVLGPNQKFNLMARMPDGLLAGAFFGKTRVFYWGWIEYFDVFDSTKQHRTEFAFELTAKDNDEATVVVASRHHSEYNADDDDCLWQPPPESTVKQRQPPPYQPPVSRR